MASSESHNTLSEETFDFICTSCAKENFIKEAIKYCVECKGYCCTICVNIHKKFPQLDQHNLLDLSNSQQADDTPKLPSFPTERCSIHQGKVIDMYCGDHDVVVCYACIAIDHKNCSDIHSIPDDIDNISKDEEFVKKIDNLQTRTESLKTILHKYNEVYLQKLENAKQTTLLAITEQRRKTDAKLDRLEENARSEVHSKHNVLKSQLLNGSQTVESAINTYIEFGDKMKRAEGNKSQKFVCSKLFSSTIKDGGDIDNVETELEIFSSDNVLSFVGNSYLSMIEELGVVNVRDNNEPYKLKRCQDINVKVQDDSFTCKIWGCCQFDDTTLLITDLNNHKLKRVNISQLSVEDYISVPYNIRGVCCCKNDEVAVGCFTDNMIQFVYIGQTMTLSRQMKLKHKCYHVANMDYKLYVSDDGGSVHVYDMVGTLLQTISKDASGNKLFTNSVQIALCTRGDKMFVTSFTGGVVYLDKKGNHIATVKDSDIDGADGVCVDVRGNLFVAGRKSNKVVQLGYDGKKRGVILSEEHGIKNPLSLCFKPNTCELFVIMMNSSRIRVFDLE